MGSTDRDRGNFGTGGISIGLDDLQTRKKMLDPRWINTFSESMALPLNGRTSTTSGSQS